MQEIINRNNINELDNDVINQIAAGEVVERPRSVLKELVENALDAGASDIKVELDLGGIKRITVTDNGRGLEKSQAHLMVKRHATSKIVSAKDLFEIRSMGFRGEALASIASVSSFLVQSQPDSGRGFRMRGDFGKFSPSENYEGMQGTTVEVKDLFLNLPARLAFLKKPASEWAACQETLQGLALAQPNCSFSLSHNGRLVSKWPAVSLKKADNFYWADEAVMRARLSQFLSEEVVKAMGYVVRVNNFGHFAALHSVPGQEKASRKWIHCYVNRRLVSDKLLTGSIIRGFHSHLLSGRFPLAYAFLDCDPTTVDVNVHPAKTEVRLQYNREIASLLSGSISASLRQGAWSGLPRHSESPFPIDTFHAGSSADHSMVLAKETRDELQPSGLTQQKFEFSSNKKNFPTKTAMNYQAFAAPYPKNPNMKNEWSPSTAAHLTQEETLKSPLRWSEMKYIGSFGKCYLFFEGRDELIGVDQHAFHERILYEKLLLDSSLTKTSQRLVFPELFDFTHSEVQWFREKKETLARAGLSFDVMSDTSIEITEIPAFLVRCDLVSLLSDLMKNWDEDSSEDPLKKASHLILATMACHGAVRAGEELSEIEVAELISQAYKVDFYDNCPHGRRVFKTFSLKEVGRWFDR